MKAQTGPASKELLTVAAFDAFIAVQETSVLGFFDSDSELKKSSSAMWTNSARRFASDIPATPPC